MTRLRLVLATALWATLLTGLATGPATSQEPPPGTDVFLLSLVEGEMGVEVGEPVNLTARPGYDNQPSFLPDGRLVYTVIDGGQADIWIADPRARERHPLTQTPESEYSPTPIPGEQAISVVRVETDERQRLWRFPLDGGDPNLLLPDIEPVGYHAWADDERLMLFVLGEPPTLQTARRGPGQGEILAESPGRALERLPGKAGKRGGMAFVQKGESSWSLYRVELDTGKQKPIVATVRPDREDFTVGPGGRFFMGDAEGILYSWRPGDDGWAKVADLGEHGLKDLTRLAVHPDGKLLAVVAADPEPVVALPNGGFTAELNGFKIYYEVHGEGPVMMAVTNSWGFTHDGVRALLRPLEEHFTMVYFDPRGMGRSAAVREATDRSMTAVRADFDALRRHLGLDKVHAIGWSNGAANLTYLVQENPQTLASAIYVHGGASYLAEDRMMIAERYPELVQNYATYLQKMNDSSLSDEERNALTKTYNLETLFPPMFTDPEAGREWLREHFGATEFSWPHSQFAAIEGASFDVRDALAEMDVPSLVLAGAHDMLPPERVRELHDGLPDSTFVVFEESGHFAPVEETEKFVRTVLDFLAQK